MSKPPFNSYVKAPNMNNNRNTYINNIHNQKWLTLTINIYCDITNLSVLLVIEIKRYIMAILYSYYRYEGLYCLPTNTVQ